MRICIQRVKNASVTVEGNVVGSICQGLLVLLGVAPADSEKEVDYLLQKLLNLRIFTDPDGKMNLSLLDVKGELLVVSQFTLYGDCSTGRRPSFTPAAPPILANRLYEMFVEKAKKLVTKVQTGVFAAKMEVALVNDGPITFVIDSL